MEQLFTVKEVADYLKVKSQTVYRYIDEGKLKSTKVEGNVRIKSSDLLAFIEMDK